MKVREATIQDKAKWDSFVDDNDGRHGGLERPMIVIQQLASVVTHFVRSWITLGYEHKVQSHWIRFSALGKPFAQDSVQGLQAVRSDMVETDLGKKRHVIANEVQYTLTKCHIARLFPL